MIIFKKHYAGKTIQNTFDPDPECGAEVVIVKSKLAQARTGKTKQIPDNPKKKSSKKTDK